MPRTGLREGLGRGLVERLVNSNLNAPCRCGVDVRLTVRRAAQYGTLRSRWTGVECQRFIDFEDEEEASERDVGAHGQDVLGRVGFVTFGYDRWGGIA